MSRGPPVDMGRSALSSLHQLFLSDGVALCRTISRNAEAPAPPTLEIKRIHTRINHDASSPW